jgi:hypothetical protein
LNPHRRISGDHLRTRSYCLLTIILLGALANAKLHIRAPTQTGETSLFLSFNAALGEIDERDLALYTNGVLLTVFNVNSKESFIGQFCFPYPKDRSQLDCHEIWNRDLVDGHYRWNDSEYSFYRQQHVYWSLFRTGDFPYDTFSWPILIGCNSSIQAFSKPLESLGNFPENITSKWTVGAPELLQWNGTPTNETLSSMWPGLHIPKGTVPLTNFVHWYFLQIIFTRNDSYRSWLSLIFWGPALSVFVAVVGWILWIGPKPRLRERHLNAGVGVGTGIALLAYTVLMANTYPQNGIALVQLVLIADAILLIVSPLLVSFIRRRRFQPKEDRPPPAQVYA